MSQEVKESSEFKFDINSVVYVVYLLYRLNMLTRYHLKQITKIIKEPMPQELVKFLVEEGNKA